MRLDQLLPGIGELRADDVQAYLRSRGWSRVPDARERVVVYAHPETGDEVIVPLDPRFADYARRLGEGIETLAAIVRRSPVQVLEDLSLPAGDLLSFRIRSDLVGSGTIPLLDAIRLREAQKNLLLAAAHAVAAPQRYYARMGRREPVELVAACREGQTARGSYVSTLLVPVEPEVGRLPLDEPLGRRVTRLLMETLSAVRERLVRAEAELLLGDGLPGLSYNLHATAPARPHQGSHRHAAAPSLVFGPFPRVRAPLCLGASVRGFRSLLLPVVSSCRRATFFRKIFHRGAIQLVRPGGAAPLARASPTHRGAHGALPEMVTVPPIVSIEAPSASASA